MNNAVSVGHEMLNHLGERICVTEQTLRSLDQRHYLARDRATGLFQLTERSYRVYLDLECGAHRARFARELGTKATGPSVAVCRCEKCMRKQDLGDTRLSDEITGQIVRDVTGRRRVA